MSSLVRRMLLDLVVVDLGAADDAAVLREARLDRRLELHDPVPQRLGNLLREAARVEERQLAADELAGAVTSRRVDRAKQARIRQRVRQRELGLHPALLVLFGRRDIRLPPRPGRVQVEGPKSCLRVLDDARCVRHDPGA